MKLLEKTESNLEQQVSFVFSFYIKKESESICDELISNPLIPEPVCSDENSDGAAHQCASRERFASAAAPAEGRRRSGVHRGAAEPSGLRQPGARSAAGGARSPEGGEAAAPGRAGGQDGDGVWSQAVLCCRSPHLAKVGSKNLIKAEKVSQTLNAQPFLWFYRCRSWKNPGKS